jgi:hypothetical protein
MRYFLILVAFVAALMATFAMIAAFTGGGSDIQFIAAGIYGIIFAVSIGCEGIMVRLEQIRDANKPKPPEPTYEN